MNIEELKSILNFANVNKSSYSINDNWAGNIHVLHVFNYKGCDYWEAFYSDEKGNINDYKSFVDEDIACRYFLYELIYHEKGYQDLIKKYVLDYICDNNTIHYDIKKYYGVNNYNDVMEYDRYKRNVMYYMLKVLDDDVLLSLLFNSTKFQLLDDVKNIKNPNFFDTEGCGYLYLACFNCNIQIIKLLLELGANPNIRDCNGKIPILLLDIAPYDVNIVILELMLQHGLDLNIRFSSAYRHKTLKEILDEDWGNLQTYKNVMKKYIE